MRSIVVVMLCVLVVSAPALAQAPATSPPDYVLVTVVLKHDQSKNLDEIGKIQEERGQPLHRARGVESVPHGDLRDVRLQGGREGATRARAEEIGDRVRR